MRSIPSILLVCRRLTQSADLLDDLYAFDLVAMEWTRLSTDNDTQRPSARYKHGFTSEGDRLYVHGGFNGSGDSEAKVVGV